MEIERITSPIPYEEFWSRFLATGTPCVLDESFTRDWIARKDWISDDQPNIAHLRQKFGQCSVPVADCTSKYHDSHEKITMTFSDYLDLVEKPREDQRILYLKDWHFTKDFPDEEVYRTPEYFVSDWLNEYWEEELKCVDNYKFVYFGFRGTWTPFHADVFRSFSWSANICGRKKWILVQPGEEEKLSEEERFDVTEDVLERKGIKCMVVIQNPGEVIFVPSNWHHQVWNLDDVISINHNWFNASNIDSVFSALEKEKQKVEAELRSWILGDEDDETFPASVQKVLKPVFGMDYLDFFKLLTFIGKKRLGSSQPEHERDLKTIVGVLERLKKSVLLSKLEEFVGLGQLDDVVDLFSRGT